MANELKFFGDPGTDVGLTVVCRVYDGLGNQVGADVSCTEANALAIYLGDMPSTGAGQYVTRFFNGSNMIGQNVFNWDGSQEIIPGNTNIDGVSEIELTRLFAAVLLGKVTGANTSQMYFRDIADTKDRVYAVVDTDGNRKVVTLDGS